MNATPDPINLQPAIDATAQAILDAIVEQPDPEKRALIAMACLRSALETAADVMNAAFADLTGRALSRPAALRLVSERLTRHIQGVSYADAVASADDARA